MALEVEARPADNGVTVLAPTGRLDVAGAPALKEAIGEVVRNGPPKVVIDMEGVSFVDSTGLGSVIAALKQIRNSQGELRLAAPNQQVPVVPEPTPQHRLCPHSATRDEPLTG